MISESVSFPGSRGELAAVLDRPAGRPRAFAVFAHCFTCSKDLPVAVHLSRGLAEAGIATLRFDFTGLGESAGAWSDTHFTSNIADLVHAARYLEGSFEAPSLLIGHSLGGAAVLAAAAEIPSAQAVVTIGAPFDPAHVDRHFAEHVAAIEETGEAEVTIAGRAFRVTRAFLEDIRSQDQADRIRDLRRALLVMHAPHDTVVDVENASRIFLAARHPKSFVSLHDSDHLLPKRSDAQYAARTIAAWASRYVPALAESGVAESGDRATVVHETAAGKYALRVVSGGHVLSADEPREVGGDDTGPSPYDLLLASLGACTVMTLRMYAERKGLAVTSISARLEHFKVHAADCATCESKTGKVDRIVRQITLVGDLDAAQRARLLEIADRCPVHRTLHGEVDVQTRLSDPAD